MMVKEDRILRLLLRNPEIAKRQTLLEKAIWNFYMEGAFDTIKLSIHVAHNVLKRK